MDYLSAQQYSKARDALLKEGYSEEETDRALSAHQRTYAKSSKEEPKKIDETDYLTLPVATAGGGLAVEGLRRLYNNYKNTSQNPAEVGTKIEPTFTGNAPIAPSVSPSPVQPRITTEPTATGQSTLAMLPPTAPSVPQGSIPGAPNVQATPATLPAMPPANPAQQVVEQATGTTPTPPVPASMPIGQTTPNPVESGEGSSPLHESGSAVGKTPLQATTESTVQQEKKVVKGAAVPRRSKQETQVANEEMPFNKYYNQVANRLAGTENLREHPHITEQFDKAWEDVFHNVLGGKMEKSQAGAPAKIHEIESHIKANSEKYPDLVKYMNEAKTYGKGGIHPTEGGASHLGAMLGLLGAGGLGAYMIHRYGKPYEESMEKANKAMGDTSGTQDLLQKANKAEELSPAMRQIFMKPQNPKTPKPPVCSE